MERKLKILYIANLITLFGTYFLFIPISKNFSLYFGIGTSWAIVFFIMRAPPVFLSRVYARCANKYGVNETIGKAQFLSMIASVLLLAGVYFNIQAIALLGFAFVCIFSLTLRTLYPYYLNIINKTKEIMLINKLDAVSIVFKT
ncbi:MAG: hypothetical protein ABII18_06550 [bacterium]|nr:hypothetical protein [bacterium]MBU1917778.1 hypothetical protein [bacterium]